MYLQNKISCPCNKANSILNLFFFNSLCSFLNKNVSSKTETEELTAYNIQNYQQNKRTMEHERYRQVKRNMCIGSGKE